MSTSNTPDSAARNGPLDARYAVALQRLVQRAEQLDMIPCPQTWHSAVRLLRGETADYLQTAPLPEPLREAFEQLSLRIDAAERCGWRVPPALAPWQP